MGFGINHKESLWFTFLRLVEVVVEQQVDVEEMVENEVIVVKAEASKPAPEADSPPPEDDPPPQYSLPQIITKQQGNMLFAKFKSKGVDNGPLMNVAIRGWFSDDTLDLYKLPAKHFEECKKKIDELPKP